MPFAKASLATATDGERNSKIAHRENNRLKLIQPAREGPGGSGTEKRPRQLSPLCGVEALLQRAAAVMMP